ncbi:hypothetical protein HDE_01735 [Halotydeus destructor]|nr:hypothetical protein HDE_01735 [Halotydeus destructor]
MAPTKKKEEIDVRGYVGLFNKKTGEKRVVSVEKLDSGSRKSFKQRRNLQTPVTLLLADTEKVSFKGHVFAYSKNEAKCKRILEFKTEEKSRHPKKAIAIKFHRENNKSDDDIEEETENEVNLEASVGVSDQTPAQELSSPETSERQENSEDSSSSDAVETRTQKRKTRSKTTTSKLKKIKRSSKANIWEDIVNVLNTCAAKVPDAAPEKTFPELIDDFSAAAKGHKWQSSLLQVLKHIGEKLPTPEKRFQPHAASLALPPDMTCEDSSKNALYIEGYKEFILDRSLYRFSFTEERIAGMKYQPNAVIRALAVLLPPGLKMSCLSGQHTGDDDKKDRCGVFPSLLAAVLTVHTHRLASINVIEHKTVTKIRGALSNYLQEFVAGKHDSDLSNLLEDYAGQAKSSITSNVQEQEEDERSPEEPIDLPAGIEQEMTSHIALNENYRSDETVTQDDEQSSASLRTEEIIVDQHRPTVPSDEDTEIEEGNGAKKRKTSHTLEDEERQISPESSREPSQSAMSSRDTDTSVVGSALVHDSAEFENVSVIPETQSSTTQSPTPVRKKTTSKMTAKMGSGRKRKK